MGGFGLVRLETAGSTPAVMLQGELGGPNTFGADWISNDVEINIDRDSQVGGFARLIGWFGSLLDLDQSASFAAAAEASSSDLLIALENMQNVVGGSGDDSISGNSGQTLSPVVVETIPSGR